MKKIIGLVVAMLLMNTGMVAQQAFYLTKEGVRLTYAERNGKGKTEGYSQTTVTKVEVGDERNFSITTANQIMDSRRKEVLNEPIVTIVHVRDGVVEFDPACMAGKIVEGMKITGGNFCLPPDAGVGTPLDDYSVTVSMGPIRTTTSFTDVKVTGKETLEVGGRGIDCLIVECIAVSKVMGMKQEIREKIWYARGIGLVKMEVYSRKGKLQSVQELIEVTGL